MQKPTEHFYNIADFISDETHKRRYDHATLKFISDNLKGLDSFFRNYEKDNPHFEEERADFIIHNVIKRYQGD